MAEQKKTAAKKPAAKKSNGGVKNEAKKIDGEFEKLAKAAPATGKKSPKSWLVTLLLCIFLGWCGAHRFYTGKIWTAILFWFVGWFIWWLIDLIKIATGNFRDKKGNTIEK